MVSGIKGEPLFVLTYFGGCSEYLIEEGPLVQGGLPLSVSLHRFHASRMGQGQEARRLDLYEFRIRLRAQIIVLNVLMSYLQMSIAQTKCKRQLNA
jgi:hypothetical protein